VIRVEGWRRQDFFDATGLRRAVPAALRGNVDHLVLLPEVVVEGFWETLFVTYFGVAFLFAFLPWKVADPRSEAYVGVGAFNLVRAEAYRRAGGHAARTCWRASLPACTSSRGHSPW